MFSDIQNAGISGEVVQLINDKLNTVRSTIREAQEQELSLIRALDALHGVKEKRANDQSPIMVRRGPYKKRRGGIANRMSSLTIAIARKAAAYIVAQDLKTVHISTLQRVIAAQKDLPWENRTMAQRKKHVSNSVYLLQTTQRVLSRPRIGLVGINGMPTLENVENQIRKIIPAKNKK